MKFLFFFLLLVFASNNAFSEEANDQSKEENAAYSDDELFFNVSFGVSAFECLLGVEIQKENHSLGLGICGQLSYRYYSNPYGDSSLYGLYAGFSSGYQRNESRKIIDGIVYEDKNSRYAGFGAGYRWQWLSGWNVTTTLAINFMNDEYSNPGQPKKKDPSVFLFPGITAGHKF